MDDVKLLGLRDFAISHLGRALRTQSQQHASQENYHIALYGDAALSLGGAKTPATEQIAAYLLQTVLSLYMRHDGLDTPTITQRRALTQTSIELANDLCTLTGDSLPWLANIATTVPSLDAPPTQQEAPHEPVQLSLGVPLRPGVMLSTKDAAAHLGMKVQTLYKWSHDESGPVSPVRIGTGRIRWKSDDILLMLKTKKPRSPET
jgi:predicted DNA-binding transcriptional regulator AlpA